MLTGLFIAIPTREVIHIGTAVSLCGIVERMVRRGLPHTVIYYSSSDIALSRNRLAGAFLSEDKYSHILFIDSDMEFDPAILDGLVGPGAPFVACDYPRRHLDIERFRKAVEDEVAKPANERASTEALLSGVYDFTLNWRNFDGTPWRFERRDGYLSVPAVGFGLALLAKDVFRQMIEVGCADPIPATPTYPSEVSYGFFDPVRQHSGIGWRSEDISFCKRWVQDCGGKIWLLAEPTVNHIGRFVYAGSLAQKIEQSSGSSPKPRT